MTWDDALLLCKVVVFWMWVMVAVKAISLLAVYLAR